MTTSQTKFPFGSEISVFAARTPEGLNGKPRWLGLDTDHRRLLEALQDGWLRPEASTAGWLLGVQAYAPALPNASCATPAKHAIRARMKLDVEKLPNVDVLVRRDGDWVSVALDAGVSERTPLFWLGALPTFAICELSVTTDEERARLLGLARQFANVELPDRLVIVDATGGDALDCTDPPPDVEPVVVVPPEEDAVRGAMCMAMWAVPRVDPWLDVLVASLSGDAAKLVKAAGEVDAHWWRFAPWDRTNGGATPDDLQEYLWRAATEVFAEAIATDAMPASELARRIVASAVRDGAVRKETEEWRLATQDILRGEATIALDDSRSNWRTCPVGIAIQLVLSRPDPMTFRTWCKDMPDLPPAVWWSAAVLCGLLRGYRRLDIRFRGSTSQREVLAVHALRACGGNVASVRWRHDADKPNWRSQSKGEPGFALLWGNEPIAHLRMQARGAWYIADFANREVLQTAKSIAKELRWQRCWYQELEVPPGTLRVLGTGKVYMQDDRIDVRGNRVRIRLPQDASLYDRFDPKAFRRHVTIEAGTLRAPPRSRTPNAWLGIPGLRYQPGFLSEEEEMDVIGNIRASEWQQGLKRRVQHYGWKYDYGSRKVDPTMRVGPLPGWADVIARRLVDEGFVPQYPDQVIVNEYVGKQGISKHVDSEESFADGIAMVSLGESWEMVFRHGKRKEVGTLERRSVAVMKDDARYRWTHEIPARKNEPGPPRRERGTRISLTFRKVIAQQGR